MCNKLKMVKKTITTRHNPHHSSASKLRTKTKVWKFGHKWGSRFQPVPSSFKRAPQISSFVLLAKEKQNRKIATLSVPFCLLKGRTYYEVVFCLTNIRVISPYNFCVILHSLHRAI